MARPREFELEKALNAIMGVFWRKGFEGASMQDIEAATSLNKQSLYRIYDDKRAMYLAALRHYDETEVTRAAGLLSGAGAPHVKFQRLFNDALAEATGDAPRRGCFLCNASADQAQLDDDAKEFVKAAMHRIENKFQETLSECEPYNSDTKLRKAMAAKLMSFYFGLRILVKADLPVATLKTAVRQVLVEI